MPKSKLTDLQKVELVEKYKTGNYTYYQLGKEYGLHGSAIIGLLKRRGIPKLHNTNKLIRKYTLNENYFDVIDCEDKAYFLGLLYADGCNHLNRHEISLGLQVLDINILEKFNKSISSNRPINISKSKENPKTRNPSDMATLNINSQIMSERLNELGCVQRKSLILKFPTKEQVPENLLIHFLRGMWDGDGNLCLYDVKTRKSKKLTASLVSSTIFIDKLYDILKFKFNVNSYIERTLNPSTSVLTVSGMNQAFRFLKLMYDNSGVKLNRKYEYYLNIKNYFYSLNRTRRNYNNIEI